MATWVIALSMVAYAPSLGPAHSLRSRRGARLPPPIASQCIERWPLLHRVSAAGKWKGTIHYATGIDGLVPASFVLHGTTQVELSEANITIRSSVVLPNGAERIVTMAGSLREDGPARLESERGGPISLLLAEHTAAGTILMRELNSTTGATVMATAMAITDGELVLTCHEIGSAGEVTGVQMWRMAPARDSSAALSVESSIDSFGYADDRWQDEEMFMTSGSEL